MRFKDFLQEDAAAGSVGAGSIAANPSGDSRREHKHSERDWRNDAAARREDRAEQAAKHAKQEEYHASAREKLAALKDKKKKKGFASFLQRRKVNEDFDMADIVSRLKASDTETAGDEAGVVSYGVEDDKGNSMRITVRADQAKEFEETIAKRLADNKTNTSNGINLKGNSLAEILYDLRDKFEIISVDFPTIPTDVVYNADLASKSPESDTIDDSGEFESGFDDFGNQNDFDQGGDEFGDMGDMGGDLGGDMGGEEGLDLNSDQQADLTGQEGGEAGANGDVNANTGVEGGNPEDMEGENVMDFGEEPAAPEDEGSILTQIVSMLKAQANAEEAKADAAAEEARAKQAEWSAIAAEKEVKRQEEMARVEAEVQSQKKKEKEAKKYAELARYNVEKANRSSAMESRKSFLSDVVTILQEDQFDNVQTLQKQKLQLRQKYQIQPSDDQDTQNMKRLMFQYENDELDARIKQAQTMQQYNADEAKNQQQNQQQNQNNNTSNQNNPTGSQQPSTPQVPTGNGNQAGQ